MSRGRQLWGSVGAFFALLILMIVAAVIGADGIGIVALLALPVAVLSMVIALFRRSQPHASEQERMDSRRQMASHLGRFGAGTRVLVVDCETNGLPRNWRAPLDDLENWPRAVQIAWALYDESRQQLSAVSRIVRPEGFSIDAGSTAIHGITNERAQSEGQGVGEVLRELEDAFKNATHVVAHNASFDGAVIAAEYMRLGMVPPFTPESMVCTMELSTDYCRLPGGPRGYKWPRLEELHHRLFGRTFDGAHDAGSDVAACARCLVELETRGVIRL